MTAAPRQPTTTVREVLFYLQGQGHRWDRHDTTGPYGRVRNIVITHKHTQVQAVISDYGSEDEDLDPFELDALLDQLGLTRTDIRHILR